MRLTLILRVRGLLFTMNRFWLIACILTISISSVCCQKPRKKSQIESKQSAKMNNTAIKQGICGKILWKAGNMMPSPDRPVSQGRPVVRELYVYELTNMEIARPKDGFYQFIPTKLIGKVVSNEQGEFCINLSEGQYSLFVKEDTKGFYANSFDTFGNIYPVTVEKGKVSQITFVIDYKAVY